MLKDIIKNQPMTYTVLLAVAWCVGFDFGHELLEFLRSKPFFQFCHSFDRERMRSLLLLNRHFHQRVGRFQLLLVVEGLLDKGLCAEFIPRSSGKELHQRACHNV